MHLFNGILCSGKKEETLTFCNTIDGPEDYYAKGTKQVSERKIYDLTYIWNLTEQNKLMNKIETEA